MKICMIGTGSIGTRHMHNIKRVLDDRGIGCSIDALRSTSVPLKESILEHIKHEYYSFAELPNDYDIIFITNPTSLHYNTLQNVCNKTKHIFIEKPVFHNIEYHTDDLPISPQGIYYVACPLRQKKVISYVKQLIESGEAIKSVRALSSSYLPDWRPGVDYRNTYSACKALGGGVTLDLIHEWDYLIYLFGQPKNIYNIKGHYSGLEIDSDDISIYIASYEDKTIELHIDYIGHKTERRLDLFSENHRYEIDIIQNSVNIFQRNELKRHIQFPDEDIYIKEMEYFMDCIAEKKENFNSIEYAYSVLKQVLEANHEQ